MRKCTVPAGGYRPSTPPAGVNCTPYTAYPLKSRGEAAPRSQPHVFDGIHMLMGAGYPVAVTAAAGKPHREGVDMPESVVVTAEYPSDFIAVFTISYAAMRYRTRRPAKPLRRR